jgi:peptidyl-prolyl cis-trans isomerase C
MFRFLYRFMLLLLLTGPLACQQQQVQKPQGPLIEIGQRHLSLEQFEHELQLNYPDISGLSNEKQLQLKAQLIKQLIDRELILGEAARLNVQISPDELDAELAEIRGTYSAEEFNQILKKMDKTFEAWVSALKLRLLTAKVSTAILAPQIEVTDKETEQYYRANKESFRRPAEIRARQMLFPTREEAVEILKRIKKGEKFSTLAQKYSLSPDSEKGGALGYFSEGQLPPEFDDALFNLPVRQVSDPVKSPYGFHLFVVEKRRRAGLRPYAAVKEEIVEKLYHEKEESAFHLWLEKLQKTTETTVNWDLLQLPEADRNQ